MPQPVAMVKSDRTRILATTVPSNTLTGCGEERQPEKGPQQKL